MVLAICALVAGTAIPTMAATASGVKTPVTIMTIATVGTTSTNYPEIFAGVKGAAADLNKNGGINGHPVVVITCNDNLDPTAATNCANEAVANRVTAVVGTQSNYISNILPILAAANIPSIGSANATAAEVTSPNSFTFTGGTNLLGNSGMTELINTGHNKIALVYIDLPVVGPILTGLKASIPTLGNKTGTVVATIPVSPTQTDMSTITAAIKSSGANAINLILGGQQADLVIESNYQGGIPATQVPAQAFSMNKSDLATLGAAANGIFYISSVMPLTQTKNKYVKQVLADFKTVHFNGSITDYGTQAWAATMAAAFVMKKFKVYSPGKLLNDLPKAGTINLGIIGPFNWGKPLASQLPSRIFNPNYMFSIVKNGVVTPQIKTFQNILGIH